MKPPGNQNKTIARWYSPHRINNKSKGHLVYEKRSKAAMETMKLPPKQLWVEKTLPQWKPKV